MAEASSIRLRAAATPATEAALSADEQERLNEIRDGLRESGVKKTELAMRVLERDVRRDEDGSLYGEGEHTLVPAPEAFAGLEVLVVDHTRPDVELPVVKVIVPGLRHFWRRLAPGRLYDVPMTLGERAIRNDEDTLNPVAMFL